MAGESSPGPGAVTEVPHSGVGQPPPSPCVHTAPRLIPAAGHLTPSLQQSLAPSPVSHGHVCLEQSRAREQVAMPAQRPCSWQRLT